MYNCTIVIPSLKPNNELIEVVSSLMPLGVLQVVVVNDGSDSSYDAVFQKVAAFENCTVLKHDVNKGKGRALKTGFEYVMKNFPESDGVVTADADGQHSTEDIEKICAEIVAKNGKIILGTRDFDEESVPFRSRFGNRFTSRVFQLLYGVYIPDTQTGLRGFPQGILNWLIEVQGEKFDFELNMLIHAGRHNVSFKTVPIKTLYYDNNSGSHYNPFMDSLRTFKVLIKGLLTYSVSSLASIVVDVGVFYLLAWIFHKLQLFPGISLFIATVVARILSSVVNFGMNHKVSFKSKRSVKSTAVRYYILWAAQLTASFGLVYLFNERLHIDLFISKSLTDILLSIFSYEIQLNWVFGKNTKVEK